jgi:hypothetical protein
VVLEGCTHDSVTSHQLSSAHPIPHTRSYLITSYRIVSYQRSFSCLAHQQSWVGPFLMSAVMANCIRRSNAISSYSAKLTYRESVVYPNFMAGTLFDACDCGRIRLFRSDSFLSCMTLTRRQSGRIFCSYSVYSYPTQPYHQLPHHYNMM